MKKRQPASQEFDEVDFAIIEERNKEMKELEHQLILLAEIHNDLSFLVQQQGEHIQTAEKEIETSVTNTFDASVALENAAGHAANLEKNHWFTLGTTSAATVTIGGGILTLFHPFIGIPTVAAGIAGIISVWKARFTSII